VIQPDERQMERHTLGSDTRMTLETRRIIVTIELETNEPLDKLRNTSLWSILPAPSHVHQISVNVIQPDGEAKK